MLSSYALSPHLIPCHPLICLTLVFNIHAHVGSYIILLSTIFISFRDCMFTNIVAVYFLCIDKVCH